VSDHGRPLEFGLGLVPETAKLDELRTLARQADELGFDLVGIQDHPYQWRFLDTWMLMAVLLAETKRLRVFPDVTNLPLRPPAVLAKQAASLDVLSGGRFELGLGAGSFWDAIAAMGGPRRSSREAFDALEEAIEIIRLSWSGERTISFAGRHYSVAGLHPGPPPAHPIGIWIGALRPKSLALIGRAADGWVPSLAYAPPEAVPAMQARIDDAAVGAGRDPAEIRRVYNVHGLIVDGPAEGLVVGPVEYWIEQLTGFAVDLGFDTFVFSPAEDNLNQVQRFAMEVVPGVRTEVARARAGLVPR
jgi:alkanesulfonate monooxygenase SsuD/methylene tetrahydromethanopterin reductase-like flavin-dependent oxidoreductase (luciferase family)